MQRTGLITLALVVGGCAGTSVEASASSFDVLYKFCQEGKFLCTDGKNPAANVIMDAAGNLYGTTSAGGATGNGVIFELIREGKGHTYKVLHSFDGNGEGGVPVTQLIMDTAGNLYGTATAGGSNFGGTAFELVRNGDGSWTYKVLTNFCSSAGTGCVQGMVPESPLTYVGAAAGQPYDGTSPLFGTTLEGGANGVGLAYKLTVSGGNWTGSSLYSFCSVSGCLDGQFPVGQLALDTSGNLYGTTNAGGASENSSGVLYRIATGTGAETVVYNFCSKPDCTDGSAPLPGVTLDSAHRLFGATVVGGKNGSGTVYELNAATGKEKVLYSLCAKAGCKDGVGPTAPVIEYGGTLIDTARGGNASSAGVIFRIGAADQETVLHTFCEEANCKDGSQPLGVVAAANGTLFGATQQGGRRNSGVLYKFTP